VSVVIDEPELAELVHKKAHARARRADYLRERLMANLPNDRLVYSLFTEVRHEEEHPRQSLFTRVEELVDQVLLDPYVPGQEVGYKLFGELRLVVKHADDGRLVEPGDYAVTHRRGRGQAQRLPCQTALAEKGALAMERDNRLLVPLGSDTDLDLAFLDIKYGIRWVP
jgi:hypothetical protein